MCVDNIAALRTSKGVWRPRQNWHLVQEIHDCVASLSHAGVPVRWHWTPSHEDIHGNEYADKLAKRAAFSIVPRRPLRLPPSTPRTYPQPLIPLSVSKSLTRTSLFNRQSERWYNAFAEHLGQDHLSRIQLSNSFNPGFSLGDRVTQTTLAQLRFGHSVLRAHQARFNNSSPMCACDTAPDNSALSTRMSPLWLSTILPRTKVRTSTTLRRTSFRINTPRESPALRPPWTS